MLARIGLQRFFHAVEVSTPYAPPLSSRGYHALTWRSHGHSVAAYMWRRLRG